MLLSWAEGRWSLRPILVQGLPLERMRGLRDTWQEVHLLARPQVSLWMTNSCPLRQGGACSGKQGGGAGSISVLVGNPWHSAYDDWTNILLTNVDVQTEIITRIKGKTETKERRHRSQRNHCD